MFRKTGASSRRTRLDGSDDAQQSRGRLDDRQRRLGDDIEGFLIPPTTVLLEVGIGPPVLEASDGTDTTAAVF
jgi:hypothetical protein